jgi:hypothetical protein
MFSSSRASSITCFAKINMEVIYICICTELHIYIKHTTYKSPQIHMIIPSTNYASPIHNLAIIKLGKIINVQEHKDSHMLGFQGNLSFGTNISLTLLHYPYTRILNLYMFTFIFTFFFPSTIFNLFFPFII